MALDSKEIADRIKIFRKEQKLSQNDFALKTGFKWHQIKDIETYKTKPSVELISSIVEVFNANSDRFLREGGVSRQGSGNGVLLEKQFPYMTGSDIEGWAEEDYIWDRLSRHRNNKIKREDRILEYLQERPEIKEDLYLKAVSLEVLLLRDRLLEKIKSLDEEKVKYLFHDVCTTEEEEVEEIVRRLDLNLLYHVIGRYRVAISAKNPSEGGETN